MNDLRQLSALIVDPNSGMRSSLHSMLTTCGLTKIDHAIGAGNAVRHLQARQFDLILCEYDLGDGQDGQQLLEDLRHNKIIALSTIFFMVTAERSFEKVVSAAELVPNDYLLKPFAADALMERIDRAVEKRTAFAAVHGLIATSNLQSAIDACAAGEAAFARYASDFKRLRAELHLTSGEPHLAEPIYAALIALRAVAWARLGLAKTLFLQNKLDASIEILVELVTENPKFMDAHDWLAKVHAAKGDLWNAQTVLENAVAISPHAVRRLRKLGEVALESGDVGAAEKAFQKVISKARYSEFRDPEDHVQLVKTLIRKGDTTQAATIIRDLDKSLANSPKTKACHALSSAMLFSQTGDDIRVGIELKKAVEACRDRTGLSADMKMALAASCLEHQMEDGAAEIMLDVLNNAATPAAQAKAVQLFELAGRADLADRVAGESRRIVIDLVSAGAEKARIGDYRGAVTLMMEAVAKLPNNSQVVFNAAVAILKYLENAGWDDRLSKQARELIDTARRLDAANPRLPSLTLLYKKIQTKYGIA